MIDASVSSTKIKSKNFKGCFGQIEKKQVDMTWTFKINGSPDKLPQWLTVNEMCWAKSTYCICIDKMLLHISIKFIDKDEMVLGFAT